jgi:hypothetical protein
VTYKEITEAPENRCGDHYLGEAFQSQMKRRSRLVGESLQDFIATIDHLAHRAHIELPEHLISKEAARVFAYGNET